MKKFLYEEVNPSAIKLGDRLLASYGVVTVRAITWPDETHVTFHWQEDQPAETLHRSNWPERIIAERCTFTHKGEQCARPLGHSGACKWANGD